MYDVCCFVVEGLCILDLIDILQFSMEYARLVDHEMSFEAQQTCRKTHASVASAMASRTIGGGGLPSLRVVAQGSMSSCTPSCALLGDWRVFFLRGGMPTTCGGGVSAS